MSRLRGAHKIAVANVRRVKQVTEAGGHSVAVGEAVGASALRCDPLLDLGAVLVSACREQQCLVLVLEALPSGLGVCQQGRVEVAHVGRGIRVEDWRRYVEAGL